MNANVGLCRMCFINGVTDTISVQSEVKIKWAKLAIQLFNSETSRKDQCIFILRASELDKLLVHPTKQTNLQL